MPKVLAAWLVTLLSLSSPALAKAERREDLKIEMCGLASFDAVFTKVAAIDERLSSARKLLRDGRQDLNAALGLDKQTALPDALAALKDATAGELSVAVLRGAPKLSAAAVPAELQEAIGAANRLASGLAMSMVELQGIPAEVAALTKETAAFPKRFKSEAKSAGLKPTEIPKMLKVVKKDVEITAALPTKAASVVDRAASALSALSALAQ